MKRYPDAYLKEIADEFGCSDVAVLKALRRLKISRKKTTLYKEINESVRQEFVKKLKNIPPESRVYIDECGIDQCIYREYARAPRGKKVVTKISGRKFKRTILSQSYAKVNGSLHWNTQGRTTVYCLSFGLKIAS